MRGMRWALRLVMAVALAVSVAGGASAAGKWTLGVDAGMASPTGDFGDVMQSGFGAGVFADYWINEQFSLGVDLGGSGHDAEDGVNDAINFLTEEALIAQGATSADADLEFSTSILHFGVRGTLAIPTGSQVSPYVQAGLGFYRLNFRLKGPVTADGETVNIDETEDDTNAGVNGAVGLLFHASPKVAIGVQAQLHNVFTEDESTQYFGFGAVMRFEVGGPN